MTIRVETPTGLKEISRLRVVVTGGEKRVLRLSRVKADLSLEAFYNDVPTLSVSISPASFTSSGNTTVEGVVTFTPSGGIAPYTYLCTVLSSSHSTAVLNPTTASPTLRQTGVGSDVTGTANMRVAVSDNSGQSITSDFVAEFTNFGTS